MKLRPISIIDSNLSEEQQTQLKAWLDENSYSTAIKLCQEHFNLRISRTALCRFSQRCSITDHLQDVPDAADLARQITSYAASGNPDFSAATIAVFEKKLFELALTERTDE